jgi:hypothetical protein
MAMTNSFWRKILRNHGLGLRLSPRRGQKLVTAAIEALEPLMASI